MLDNTQMKEVLKRTAIAINCTMSWLSKDKKQDLAQIVAMQKAVYDYKPTQTDSYFEKKVAETEGKLAKCDGKSPCVEKLTNLLAVYREQLTNPDTLPCIEYLKIIAVRQAYKPGNFIAVKGQRIAEKEQQEMEEALAELNYDGETSKYSATFRTVSFDQLQEDIGFEPEHYGMNAEEALIEAEEDAIHQKQVDAFKANPFYGSYLKLAIDHFNNGGNMKSFAASLGMSGQTAINRLKKMAREANNTNQLPFVVAENTVAYVPTIPTKKQTKKTVASNNNDQLNLF